MAWSARERARMTVLLVAADKAWLDAPQATWIALPEADQICATQPSA